MKLWGDFMCASSHLRAHDWRGLWNLAGACRELGDDREAWRKRVIDGLSGFIGADAAFCVELGGVRSGRLADQGFVCHGLDEGMRAEIYHRIGEVPALNIHLQRYVNRAVADDGIVCTRRGVVEDSEWYRSPAYGDHHRPLGMDHMLWCFRTISTDPRGDAMGGLTFYRELRARDFSAREQAMVREFQTAIAPQVGRTLARFSDPSPAALPPRVRQVLACLLEGDGDKQVAARLGLRPVTVNEYTKRIYRHFGVRSRTELMARWVRRGWNTPPAWLDPD